jgi:putative transcription factor
MNDHQDWTTVILTNKNNTKTQSKKIILKQGDQSINNQLRKIENQQDNFVLPKINSELCKEITSARILLKLTQKDMAVKLNIQSNVYNDIENGTAIYNAQIKDIIRKIEKIANIKFLNKKQ